MNHQEYIREVPGAKTAFIFIHGIMGTPDHFDALIPLVSDGVSVYNILLDGHGKKVMDFTCSSMKKWRTQVEVLFERISPMYEKIVLVGHSMGTLFSIQTAVRHPEKIPFVFLLASPMQVGLRPVMVANALRVALSRIDESDPLQLATKNATSIQPDARLIPYVTWVPRFLELFREIADTRKLLPGLTVPVIAYQSHMDEMVSRKAAEILKDSGKVQVHVLPDSTHFYYPEMDKQTLLEGFSAACNTYL